MKLNKKQTEIILDFGYLPEDIPQIEKVIEKTVYSVSDYGAAKQKITRDKAIELLGIRNFLAGISRSAFHWTSSQEYKENCVIYFDSSRLFKNK